MNQPSLNTQTVHVWDIFVRLFHWTLVAGFAIAYLSEGEPLWLHIWAGYAVASVVVLRIVWGFIGPKHARFSDFIFPVGRIVSHLLDELRFRAKRFVGHSPAGGAMIIVLLASLLLTTASGAALLAREKGIGPFSSLIAQAPEKPQTATAAGESREGKDSEESAWEEIHELIANLTLVLVVLHVGGVLLASFGHGENLVASMIHGRKRLN